MRETKSTMKHRSTKELLVAEWNWSGPHDNIKNLSSVQRLHPQMIE